ncbi:MAG: DUF3127 domain-containing protein [Flavobacteriales bacterium]|jgi:hypothetical protein|nr:DUF3127 domain-containing protein [Flavobacteriales bacterium]MCB0756829.1 DUF3127 domain-containing protein [Flavobacteriales bacterium]
MASVTISGTVKVVGETQQISEKFSKRELVVTESGGQYPQHIPVEFTQDKTQLLNDFGPGDEVSVTCYVNGREWTGRDGVTKHFLSLKGDRIEKLGAQSSGPRPAAQAAPPPPSMADMPPADGEDDLPF